MGPRLFELGSKRSKPGSVAAAVAGYFASRIVRAGLAPTTRSTRRRISSNSASSTGKKPSLRSERVTSSAW